MSVFFELVWSNASNKISDNGREVIAPGLFGLNRGAKDFGAHCCHSKDLSWAALAYVSKVLWRDAKVTISLFRNISADSGLAGPENPWSAPTCVTSVILRVYFMAGSKIESIPRITA